MLIKTTYPNLFYGCNFLCFNLMKKIMSLRSFLLELLISIVRNLNFKILI